MFFSGFWTNAWSLFLMNGQRKLLLVLDLFQCWKETNAHNKCAMSPISQRTSLCTGRWTIKAQSSQRQWFSQTKHKTRARNAVRENLVGLRVHQILNGFGFFILSSIRLSWESHWKQKLVGWRIGHNNRSFKVTIFSSRVSRHWEFKQFTQF